MLHVVECVAPHGVLLHIATRQPPPLPVSGSPAYSRVTKLSSESYLLPTCTMGLYQPLARDQRPKVGRGNKQWRLPLPKWRKTISGTLSTGSETENNVCMIKHDLTVNRRWDDPIWLGGRLEAANNGDMCQSHNREVQLKKC